MPRVAHAICTDDIGNFANELFTDVAAKLIPTAAVHGWHAGVSVVEDGVWSDTLCEERRNTLTVKLNKAGKKCVTNSVSKSVT